MKFWIHFIITLSGPIMINLEEVFGITMGTYAINKYPVLVVFAHPQLFFSNIKLKLFH